MLSFYPIPTVTVDVFKAITMKDEEALRKLSEEIFEIEKAHLLNQQIKEKRPCSCNLVLFPQTG